MSRPEAMSRSEYRLPMRTRIGAAGVLALALTGCGGSGAPVEATTSARPSIGSSGSSLQSPETVQPLPSGTNATMGNQPKIELNYRGVLPKTIFVYSSPFDSEKAKEAVGEYPTDQVFNVECKVTDGRNVEFNPGNGIQPIESTTWFKVDYNNKEFFATQTFADVLNATLDQITECGPAQLPSRS